MINRQKAKREDYANAVPRRQFLKLARVVISGVSSCVPATTAETGGIPAFVGYILVDTKKCQGCLSCMLACSLYTKQR